MSTTGSCDHLNLCNQLTCFSARKSVMLLLHHVTYVVSPAVEVSVNLENLRQSPC